MVQGLVAGGSSRQEVQITSWERMTQPVYTVYPLTVYMVYTVFCGFGIAGLGKLLRIIWFIRFFTVFFTGFCCFVAQRLESGCRQTQNHKKTSKPYNKPYKPLKGTRFIRFFFFYGFLLFCGSEAGIRMQADPKPQKNV